MERGAWTFLDTGENTGAFNMELDESLARQLATGESSPVLRLYRWKPWAISLGHHQEASEIDGTLCKRDGIDLVRRPTGGRAILHAEELTYSVVMKAGRRSILQVYNDISQALVRGLAAYGVETSLEKSQPNFAKEYRTPNAVPCFSSSARYEIEYRGRKLVGSAQRRLSEGDADVVLQHGSILCGSAHVRLADYLAKRAHREEIRTALREKTANLQEITGETVDMARLAQCIRQGFEEAWQVRFRTGAQPHPHMALT
ncbi:MAG TPA: lipoate--protein ligase family protein [Bacteroidota bacterium]|nr:lipoate--protein ligase family protein [Bacteroidota bacterium]